MPPPAGVGRAPLQAFRAALQNARGGISRLILQCDITETGCCENKLATQIGFSTNINIQTNNQFNHIAGAPEPFTVVTDERVLCVPSHKAAFLGMPGSFQTP